MLTLYTKPGCPFCAKVLDFVAANNITIDEERSIVDEAAAHELLARGGKLLVPYLVDTEKDVAMYESDDIVAFLQEHYVK